MPSRRQRAFSLCISFSAFRAFAALFSCHTPIMALITRIRMMTKGSTKAVMPSPLFWKIASVKEKAALKEKDLDEVVVELLQHQLPHGRGLLLGEFIGTVQVQSSICFHL